MLKKNVIRDITRVVKRQFPEYARIKPTVTTARIEPQVSIYRKLSMGIPRRRATIYKMRFKRAVTTEDDVALKRILTVTFNERGDIIKITESK